jgi:serine/threonine-protein kinase
MPPGSAAGAVVPANARSFGKYSLLLKLATGGMAEIFLARLKGVAGFEKFVVIKRILPHLVDDEQFVAMFLDEARIAARISHPHVCQVYELGEVDGQYFIAMEYLEGVTMTQVVRKLARDRRTADLRLSVALLAQACEGLHHAHELRGADGQPIGVVHRDVSPQNLLVTAGGVLKVLDFGIAKAAGASSKTRTGTVKGKYAYMSPEQLRGEPLDRRADVFALGVVLFEALTGRRLFWRETDFLMFKAITEEPIPRAAELRPDLPHTLDAALTKALSRSRDARYATARMFGDAITGAIGAIGGALPTSQLGAELERMFADELAEHRALVTRVVSPSGSDAEPTVPGPPMPVPMTVTVQQVETRKPSSAADVPTPVPEGFGLTPGPELLDAARALHEAPTQALPASGSALAAAPTIADAERMSLPLPPPESSGPIDLASVIPPTKVGELAIEGTATSPSNPSGELASVMVAPGSGVGPRIRTGTAIKSSQVERVTPSYLPWVIFGAVTILGATIGFLVFRGGDDPPRDTASVVPTASERPSRPTVSPLAADAGVAALVVTPPPPRKEDPPPPKKVDQAPPTRVDDPPPRREPPPKKIVKTDPPPRKQPPPKPDKDPVPDGPPGSITIDSDPWATIWIDGKKQGPTPLVRVSLSPGEHTVKAKTADGRVKTFTIKITSGKEASPRKLTW